jgi:hypothetical protein
MEGGNLRCGSNERPARARKQPNRLVPSAPSMIARSQTPVNTGLRLMDPSGWAPAKIRKCPYSRYSFMLHQAHFDMKGGKCEFAALRMNWRCAQQSELSVQAIKWTLAPLFRFGDVM